MRWLTPLIASVLFLAACASHHAGDGPSSLATSVDGRPIHTWTISGPRHAPRVLIVGGIHGDEPEALCALEPLRQSLSRSGSSTVYLIDNVNPDGSFLNARGNARGVDLNRNWPARSFATARRHGSKPLSEPETQFLYACINRFKPDLIIVCHSARSGPFVNFDGPAGQIAAAFSQAAAEADPRWHVRPSMGYPTPGSLGTWAGVERQIPILTVEFARGHDAELATHALVHGTHAAIAAMRDR